MKLKNNYFYTIREDIKDEEAISGKLLVRSGMIKKSSAGVYMYLPIGYKVLKNIESIIREELNKEGLLELSMPTLITREIYAQTGRTDSFGSSVFSLKDRFNRDYILGPTHEELFTIASLSCIKSYKDMPYSLYQFQTKFRDEPRPRYGLIRVREFVMKDAYSFDRDEAGLDKSYEEMYDAYTRIFDRCGLTYRPVEADSGAIGGNGSHEFMVLADSGEAEIVYCSECEYAADIEKAELHLIEAEAEEAKPVEKVLTPNCKTIEAVCEYLHLPVEKSMKAVAFQSEKGLILCFVRGDHEVNEIKVINTVGVTEVEMAEPEILAQAGTFGGYMGPVGIDPKKAIIVVDQSVMQMHNICCGANEEGYHLVNVNPGRDFTPTYVADIRLMAEGDPCPHCGAPVKKARGIEVGQVFKLFTKYSQAMKATFLDENGKEQPMVMGCYGIGVGRTMAAAVEQNNDKDGMIWPAAIAPYQVLVVPVNVKDAESNAKAEAIYNELLDAGLEVVIDDRKERPGVKFKDADLIGYPLRVVVGPKTLQTGELEVKLRKNGEVKMLPLAGDYVTAIKDLLKDL